MARKVTHTCCAVFERAKENGTDNEGWGSLLFVDEDDGRTKIGDRLPPIAHCPWCGACVTQPN